MQEMFAQGQRGSGGWKDGEIQRFAGGVSRARTAEGGADEVVAG